MKNKIWYYIINILFVGAALCFVNYDMLFNAAPFDIGRNLLVLVLFLIIHAAKFARMYFILLEDLINPNRFLQLYVKTTLVSTLFPFKVGEFFKMYCYGVETNNYMKGIVAVLVEKFFDAVVLCLIMLPCALMGNGLSVLLIILLFFVIIIALVYGAFNGIYGYLNKFLITRGGGHKSVLFLKILEKARRVYDDIKAVLDGRVILSLLLSLVAWCAEGALVLSMGNSGIEFGSIIAYINDAFLGISNVLFEYYACLSVVVFVVILAIIYGKKYLLRNRKEGKNV